MCLTKPTYLIWRHSFTSYDVIWTIFGVWWIYTPGIHQRHVWSLIGLFFNNRSTTVKRVTFYLLERFLFKLNCIEFYHMCVCRSFYIVLYTGWLKLVISSSEQIMVKHSESRNHGKVKTTNQVTHQIHTT